MSHFAAQTDPCFLEHGSHSLGHGRSGCYETSAIQEGVVVKKTDGGGSEGEESVWRVTNFLHCHCDMDENMAGRSPVVDTQV